MLLDPLTGQQARFQSAQIVISVDTLNFNLGTALVAQGWDGVSAIDSQVIIESGVVVYSNGSTPAYDVGSSINGTGFHKLTNNGKIIGDYGNGGSGGTSSKNGTDGETALRTQAAITVDNNGEIIGGGGGGGGGNHDEGELNDPETGCDPADTCNGGNGGHGYGRNESSAVSGGGGQTGPGCVLCNVGGAGGGKGANGSNGSNSFGTCDCNLNFVARGTGGSKGHAIIGNAYITYETVGTRHGTIST